MDGTNATFITYMNSTSTSIRKPSLIDVAGSGFLIYSDCETTYNVTSGQYNYTNYIWKYNLATSEKSLFLQLEGMDKLITGLKCSPFGDKIAYAVGSELWVVDINGTQPPTNITPASEGKVATFIDWTPNGTTLTYLEINGTITDWGISIEWASWNASITAVNWMEAINMKFSTMVTGSSGRQLTAQLPHTSNIKTWEAIHTF